MTPEVQVPPALFDMRIFLVKVMMTTVSQLMVMMIASKKVLW